MATTKIWDVRGRIKAVISYIENADKTSDTDVAAWSMEDQQCMTDVMSNAMDQGKDRNLLTVLEYAANSVKTGQRKYVTGINCSPVIAREQMMMTKQRYHKEDGIVAYHGYQSFRPGEVDAEMAHKIGLELANILWGDRFQVIVSTHLDKAHIHNHFVLNSVSFVDGLKYYDQNKTYQRMRDVSDNLCQKYLLSVIEHPARHSRSRAEWEAEKEGKPTWLTAVRQDLDRAIMGCISFKVFTDNMRAQGYAVEKRGTIWRIKPRGHDKFSRLARFGENYTEEAIRERISRNQYPTRPPKPEPQKVIHVRVYGDYKLSKITLKGLQALYFFYLRKLREARRQQSPYTPYILRDDIRKLDATDRQTRFLFHHKIETEEELTSYKNGAEEQIKALSKERNDLKNEMRHTDMPEQRIAEVREKITGISSKLKTLRQDVKLCDAIVVRSLEIAEKSAQLKEIKRKEVEKKHEPTGRSSRTDRQYGDQRNREGR